MTWKGMREKAEEFWWKEWWEAWKKTENVCPNKGSAISAITVALKAAKAEGYREGVEAMRDKWIEEEGDRFAPQRAADWLLEGATPNETTREAIDEAERGEAATYNDAQTLFAHLGLDEEDAP